MRSKKLLRVCDTIGAMVLIRMCISAGESELKVQPSQSNLSIEQLLFAVSTGKNRLHARLVSAVLLNGLFVLPTHRGQLRLQVLHCDLTPSQLFTIQERHITLLHASQSIHARHTTPTAYTSFSTTLRVPPLILSYLTTSNVQLHETIKNL